MADAAVLMDMNAKLMAKVKAGLATDDDIQNLQAIMKVLEEFAQQRTPPARAKRRVRMASGQGLVKRNVYTSSEGQEWYGRATIERMRDEAESEEEIIITRPSGNQTTDREVAQRVHEAEHKRALAKAEQIRKDREAAERVQAAERALASRQQEQNNVEERQRQAERQREEEQKRKIAEAKRRAAEAEERARREADQRRKAAEARKREIEAEDRRREDERRRREEAARLREIEAEDRRHWAEVRRKGEEARRREVEAEDERRRKEKAAAEERRREEEKGKKKASEDSSLFCCGRRDETKGPTYAAVCSSQPPSSAPAAAALLPGGCRKGDTVVAAKAIAFPTFDPLRPNLYVFAGEKGNVIGAGSSPQELLVSFGMSSGTNPQHRSGYVHSSMVYLDVAPTSYISQSTGLPCVGSRPSTPSVRPPWRY